MRDLAADQLLHLVPEYLPSQDQMLTKESTTVE
jgi:hypothetical protein